MTDMSRKEKLLGSHRRKKRLGVALCLIALAALGFYAGFLWVLPCLLLLWVVHEARFSDHLFYAPASDYRYQFDAGLDVIPVNLVAGRLTLADGNAYPLDDNDTLILEITPHANLLGCWFDPALHIKRISQNPSPAPSGRPLPQGERVPPLSPCGRGDGGEGELVRGSYHSKQRSFCDSLINREETSTADCQTFERGVKGLRYLNLTGFGKALREHGLLLQGKHCRLAGTPRLLRASHPDYRQMRLLVIAPHADDAELAAFGLYSQAKEPWIVTLTAGEIEAEHYRQMGLSSVDAARIKGRLRAWDSISVPLWGNVPFERSIQLGYFCMKLAAMRATPTKAIASEAAGLSDTRPFRVFNRFTLTSDKDGLPTWQNLLSDLREIIRAANPEVIVLPHPLLDPHSDHVAAHTAVIEALAGMDFSPVLLCYANHLHDTDRWPMGYAHSGVALPPLFENAGALIPWVLPLEKARQIDKAMALAMMHDLSAPLSFKELCRRVLQRFLVGRKHPPYGENGYFRKAVRQHELFFLDSATSENVSVSAPSEQGLKP